MRRITMAFLLLFLTAPPAALAYQDMSFRAASTGGLLEDDFDLLRDPARITEIQGRRVWTNLSNFVDHSEGVFDGTSRDAFLAGGYMSMGTWHGAVVYDQNTSRTPQLTGLFDRYGAPLYGVGEREDAVFTDLDGDAAYDRLRQTRDRREAFWSDSYRDGYAGVAKELGASRVGLSFTHYHGDYTSRDPSDNTRTEITETNLITGQSLYSDLVDGVGETITEDSSNGILLSYWRPIRSGLSAGARVGASRFTEETTYDARMTQATDRAPALPDVSTFHSSWTYQSLAPRTGWDLQAGATAFYEWSPQTQCRVYVDVHRETFEYDSDAQTLEKLLSTDRQLLGSDVQTDSYNDSSGGPLTGDGSAWSGSLFGYVITRLSSGATFAGGLRVSSYTSEMTEVTQSQTLDVRTFDDGDGVPTVADFTQTVTSSQALREKTTSSVREASVPVGLEFVLHGPVLLRLGAVHSEYFTESTVTDIQTAFSGTVTRTEYGDGTFTEDLGGTSSQVPGSTQTVNSRSSETQYSYGLGIQVTDNLQIDIMGFSDVTDLSDWEVSAVIELH